MRLRRGSSVPLLRDGGVEGPAAFVDCDGMAAFPATDIEQGMRGDRPFAFPEERSVNASIYYFSGTGNSLAVAKRISGKLGGARLISMAALLREEEVVAPSEITGFVFPAYFVDVPDFVAALVARMDLRNAKHIFAAVTCGGTPGNSLYTFSKILERKNLALGYGYEIPLGDNSIVYHTEESELKARIEKLDGICEEIARNAAMGKSWSADLQENPEWTSLKATLEKLLAEEYRIADKQANPATCTSCGRCVKLCPTGSISIAGGKVTWNGNCLNCFSCLNLCATASIRFGKIAPDRSRQYRFPGTSLSELAGQRRS